MTQDRRDLFLAKTHDKCAVKRPKLTAVFVHGIAADSSSFARALAYLEGAKSLEAVRFVAFDLLGAGESYDGDDLNYDYTDQLTALHNSIEKLHIDTPLVLIGHSMGTLIATRYAHTYKGSAQQLILVSPPVYTERDLKSTAFMGAIELFKDAVAVKSRKVLEGKTFNNSMSNIVLNKDNYKTLAGLRTPATLIYGDLDQFIAAYNIPKLLRENPEYLTAIRTTGRHGVSRDKYSKIAGLLEDMLDEIS